MYVGIITMDRLSHGDNEEHQINIFNHVDLIICMRFLLFTFLP